MVLDNLYLIVAICSQSYTKILNSILKNANNSKRIKRKLLKMKNFI